MHLRRWLAAFIAEKYMGMGKTESEAYPGVCDNQAAPTSLSSLPSLLRLFSLSCILCPHVHNLKLILKLCTNLLVCTQS